MPHQHLYRTIAATALLVGGSALPAASADKPASAPPAAAVAAINAPAAGSSEDSLKNCLARIPKDSTGGQRMIAEQSCRRDEGDRKPFLATGGR